MSTIDKALDTLFLLSERAAPQRLSDIAQALDMPRSSTHRILAPLVARGLAERDERGRYGIGLGLLALGLSVAGREPLAQAARPILESAAEDFGETFFLVVARAGKPVVLEKAEGSGFMRAAPRLGARVPVHATAVGKLFLAFAPDSVQLEVLTRFTAATPCSEPTLMREVDLARQQRWAVNDEQWQAGLAVVAAPIFVEQRLVACVAMAMLSARLHELGESAVVRRVVHAAEGIALRCEVSQV